MQGSPKGRPGGAAWARAADWCARLQTWLMAACLVVMVVLLAAASAAALSCCVAAVDAPAAPGALSLIHI